MRCYSISSPPAATGYLEISVKRQGLVSNALHAGMRPGSLLVGAGARPVPSSIPADDDRPLVAVRRRHRHHAAHQHAAARGADRADAARDAALLARGARPTSPSATSSPSLARRHPQVRVCLAASRDAPGRRTSIPGRIDDALIQAAAPDVAHGLALLCGPQAMIDGVSGAARPARHGRRRRSAPSCSRPRWPPPSRPRDAARRRRSAGAATRRPSNADGHALRGARCPCSRGPDAARRGRQRTASTFPSLCRAGVCGTCRTRVVEGDVECSSTMLDDEDRAAGFVLACVASPRGDCVIEA